MSLYPGFESDAEPPYTPLGFNPDKPGPDGRSEFSKSMEAIDLAFDHRKDLPLHVQSLGKVALYAELTKQVIRNKIPDNYQIDESAKRGTYAPDRLLELMADHEIIRAIEIGRWTELGQSQADQMIHQPVQQSLQGSGTLGTVILGDELRLKQEPAFVSEELVAMEVKQKQMAHVQNSIQTSMRILFLVDRLHSDTPSLDDMTALEAIVLDSVNGHQETPQWLTPSLTTYYAIHPQRLKGLSPEHYHGSPNLDVWTPPVLPQKK